ncbi:MULTISPECIES: YgiW/YdeI family stress tolerance OB fold protein [Enterobacter]|uniref:YgiW/YdeI family stress tolerance OB fold protein n=1 Tax=Enterobacter TaxID=547 RepID=UPI001F238802|nr:YgiW/YdeI family stress tolerance OB fold protein [Enterobacter quasiroggenkampii]
MKKTVLITLLAGISFGVAAQQQGFVSPTGQGYSQGGFSGPTPGLTSVAQAKTFRDDSWVVLEGNITRQVGHELYEFRDASGTVYVDIDDKYWLGQTASPNSKIHIEGEVDKDWNSVEIDVKNLRVIK